MSSLNLFRTLDATRRGCKQFTLAIFKPELVANISTLKEAVSIVCKHGFIFAYSRKFQFSREAAEKFYAVHEGKFFHERLMRSTSSGPVVCSALFAEDAIVKWRHLIGPTDVEKARLERPDSLRAMYGITETKNGFHGSDSVESARREISLALPDFSQSDWLTKYEKSRSRGKWDARFDEKLMVHRLDFSLSSGKCKFMIFLSGSFL